MKYKNHFGIPYFVSSFKDLQYSEKSKEMGSEDSAVTISYIPTDQWNIS